MSYLLETLKRLEQKRHGEGTSDLLLVHEGVTREVRKKAVWPYVLSVALLANAAVALWWIAPWRADLSLPSPSPPASREAGQPSSSVPPQTAAKDKQETPLAPSKTDMDAKRPSSAGAVAQPAAREEGKSTKREVSPGESSSARSRPEQAAGRQQTSASPALPVEKKVVPNGRIFNVQELPDTVKAGIPQMKLSVHSYEADRSSRLVRINDKTLREGQFLTQDIKIEEITPDGVVFSCRGYLFRIPLDYGR